MKGADERDSLSPIRHRPLLADQGQCVAVIKPLLNFRISAGSATDRTSPDGVSTSTVRSAEAGENGGQFGRDTLCLGQVGVREAARAGGASKANRESPQTPAKPTNWERAS